MSEKRTVLPPLPKEDRPRMALEVGFKVYKDTSHGPQIRCQYPLRYHREDWLRQCPNRAQVGHWYCGSHRPMN